MIAPTISASMGPSALSCGTSDVDACPMTPMDREVELQSVRRQIDRLIHARLEGHLGTEDLAFYERLVDRERRLLPLGVAG